MRTRTKTVNTGNYCIPLLLTITTPTPLPPPPQPPGHKNRKADLGMRLLSS